MKKRIFGILAVMTMLMALMAITVHAETYGGICGDNVTWTFTDDGTLTISGTGEMMDMYHNDYCYADPSPDEEPWGSEWGSEWGSGWGSEVWHGQGLKSKIKRVEIDEGVTSIGGGAFYNCSNLTEIEIPDSVTYIGEYAFNNCSKLTEIDIPDGVTSIGGGAFYSCTGLTSIEIPDSVTEIGYNAFLVCTDLKTVVMGKNIKFIGNTAFGKDSKIKEVYYGGTLEEWNSIRIDKGNEYLKDATIFTCESDLSGFAMAVNENAVWGDKIAVSGCYLDTATAKIEIQTDGGVKLAEAKLLPLRKYFCVNFAIPSNMEPAGTGESKKKTMKIKAVAYDASGAKLGETDIKTVSIVKDDKITFDDVYYGPLNGYSKCGNVLVSNKLAVCVKLGRNLSQSDIESSVIKVGTSYRNMQFQKSGKYAGYYQALVSGMNLPLGSSSVYAIIKTKSGNRVERYVGSVYVLIDPSGYIKDPDGNPIEGVKVTLQKKQENGKWVAWDAENYMQSNPVYSDETGYYGWDVVEGTYRVVAEKEGYKTTIIENYDSTVTGIKGDTITVMPPRTDVDFTMDFANPSNPPKKNMTETEAKAAVERALGSMELMADANDVTVIKMLEADLADNIYVSFVTDTYKKTNSTETKNGNINGRIYIENLNSGKARECAADIPLKRVGEALVPIVNKKYSQQLSVTSAGNYGFKRLAGIMPEGLTIDKEGLISGTPTKAGSYNIQIKAEKSGKKVNVPLSMYVLPQVVKVKVTAPTDAAAGTACTATAVCYDANDTNCATPLTDVSATLTYGSDAKTSVTEAGVYAIHVSVPNGYVISEVIGDQYITVKAAE